jgi:5-methylcytosine-specific restriction endonuclease McrA
MSNYSEKLKSPRKALKYWMRKKIFERDLFTCLCCGLKANIIPINYDGRNTLLCGASFLVLDHVNPYIKGGECVEDNMQTLCDICNSKKGIKLIDYRKNI